MTMTPKGRRRLHHAIWITAVCALLVTAVTGWALWDGSHVRESAVPGDVLVSSDGRTLSTPVIWTGCEDRPRLVAHEATHTVSLSLQRKRHTSLPSNTACVGSGGSGDERLLTTTLEHPLGARRLADAVSGSIITPFRASRLYRPRFLPKGYTLSDRPVGKGDVTQPPYRRTLSPSWTVTYLRNPGRGGDTGSLSISQTVGRLPDGSGAPISVHDHPGRLEGGPFHRQSLTWWAAGFTINMTTADQSLSKDELLKIAEQLSP
ncbi:hypothetical protein ACH4UM_19860 [Streptomyces sp. NPDC020801]|uniref:hypothetical protein n=1 Tax=unclassified Streptomyces TaxID=2593676 RepID=UPI0037B3F4E2